MPVALLSSFMPHSPPDGPDSNPPLPTLDISIVAPAHNEEDNVQPLADEIAAALSPLGVSFEVVVVDDGSTDATRARLLELMKTRPWLRTIAMTRTPKGKGAGQSAAFYAGFHSTRGRLVGCLDADLQNDPAEFPKMLEVMKQTGADMVQGDRSHARKDNVVRRVGSIVGRTFRKWLLGDTIRDTGCALRIMKREIAVQLPLQFKGMHRFVPVTARHLGYTVVEMRVNHRPRVAGETKYGMGIVQRAIPGLIDLFAVRWMKSRRRPIDHAEIPGSKSTQATTSAGAASPVVIVSPAREGHMAGSRG